MSNNPVEPFSPRKYTILVIDDKPTNLMVLVDYLHDTGFRVLTARSGESGIQRAILGKPDIILLDVLMPGIDGFETCQLLKKQPETEHIPIIFMTALHDARQKVRGFELGAIDYIMKPFQQEEVFARLKTHLLNRDLMQRLGELVGERTADLESALKRERSLIGRLQKALDKEVELNALKSQMIEVISHEFRTPLTIIGQATWFLKRLIQKSEQPKFEKYFNRIDDSIDKIDSLVSEVNEIEKFHNKQVQLNVVEMPLSYLIQSIQTNLLQTVSNSVRLKFETIEVEHAKRIQLDLQLVQQIVLELVENGLKFSTSDCFVIVQFDVRGNDFIVSVIDEGIGVPVEEQRRLFEAFFRAENVDARLGLGLGLFRSQQKAEAMKGQLMMQSKGQNWGSIFTLTLPVQPPKHVPEPVEIETERLLAVS